MEDLRRRSLQRERLEQEASEDNNNDELWNEEDELVQIPVGDKNKPVIKTFRRSTTEAVLALWIHLIFLVYCIAVNVYDSTLFKRCQEKNKYYPGHKTFGGRFKYLSYMAMWCLLVYFFIAFFTDIMPRSPAKGWFTKLTDWFFTTVVWSTGWIVVLLYWIIFITDPKMLASYDGDNTCIPPLMNHALHTFPVPIVIIEAMLVFHYYPSNLVASFSIFTISSGYFIWVLIIFSKLKKWPYSFMANLNSVTFIIFMASLTIFWGFLYFIGKSFSSFRWGERFSVLREAEVEEDEE